MNQIDNEIFNIKRIKIRILEQVAAVIPFQDATMGPFPHFGISIITLEDNDGNIGESPVYNSYLNILETCLFPILFHSQNVPYREFFPLLYWSIRNEGFKGAASALLGQLDMALYDLAARRKGIPLHQYMGAVENEVKMYGSGGGTNYSFAQLEQEVNFFLEAGVDCYKMKIGKDFGKNMKEDITRVKFVKNLLGNGVRLAVDANQVWNCTDVFNFIDAVGEDNLSWIEEPIHSAAYDLIETLCKATKVTVAYGESERTSKIFPTLVNCGVRHLQPVPTQIGGIKEWLEVRDLSINKKLDFSSGGYSLYSAFLMAASNGVGMIEYLYSIMYGLEKYFLVYPSWRNGKFIFPDIAGIPVRIDWDNCYRENRIIREFKWEQADVPRYKPIVSM
ncbi:mandelate racemase/muconate lactonizing enzyme family protein [Pedobacter nyackensis]|uniref:L-alanine-DL-glutamate epimerase n=1 Tax=Pedobacter nyackensis TaxID=475255 RepID=A0A1W2CQ44_9SPHI|nr:enolase C-terminal domain-like protein [Pedobacter nyackensis]SMC87321.1 L-alanine-DL-glutamate epimerase [Pedobacter nyackensis]